MHDHHRAGGCSGLAEDLVADSGSVMSRELR
jgi:hypothetical protein